MRPQIKVESMILDIDDPRIKDSNHISEYISGDMDKVNSFLGLETDYPHNPRGGIEIIVENCDTRQVIYNENLGIWSLAEEYNQLRLIKNGSKIHQMIYLLGCRSPRSTKESKGHSMANTIEGYKIVIS